MKVAIIGTGNMGAGLATELAAAKFEVVIGSRDPAKAAALAEKIGSNAQGGGIAAAVKLADTVILALPYGAISDALRVAGDLSGKTLVDITNPISADYKSLVIGHTTSAAEEIAKALPGAEIVKAFNTVLAQVLNDGADFGNGQTVPVFIASDSARGKDMVKTLAESIGFATVDSGGLQNARYLEPLAGLNIYLAYGAGRGTSIAPTWISRA